MRLLSTGFCLSVLLLGACSSDEKACTAENNCADGDCLPGFQWVDPAADDDFRCEAIVGPPCPSGQELVAGNCAPLCPTDRVRDMAGVCVCPMGQFELANLSCVPTINCPPNSMQVSATQCRCDMGFVVNMMMTGCIPIAQSCGMNETFNMATMMCDCSMGFVRDMMMNCVAANTAPVADAGMDITVNRDHDVTLAGMGTDADMDMLTYTWTQNTGPMVTLSDVNDPAATFRAPNMAATIELQLEVDDGADTHTDTVTITVVDMNVPVADAGPDQDVDAGAVVTLDGSASRDPDMEMLTYAWTQTSGPMVMLSSTTAQQPTFTHPGGATALVFELVVTNATSMNASSADSVSINLAVLTAGRAEFTSSPFRTEIDANGLAVEVQVAGNILYVAEMIGSGFPGRFHMYDITDPKNSMRLGRFDFDDTARELIVSGTTAYLVEDPGPLFIVDVMDPNMPAELGRYTEIGASFRDVAVDGNTAYLVEDNDGLIAVDITTPATPMRLGGLDPGATYRSVAISGTTAFVGDADSLRIIDVSTPAMMMEIGSENVGATVFDIVLDGTHAYLRVGTAGLVVVDISTLITPNEVARLDLPGNESKLTIAGTTAYVASGTAGVNVVDISTPNMPMLVGTVDTNNAFDVAVLGSTGYVADELVGTTVVDLSITGIATAGRYATAGNAMGLSVVGSTAYVAQDDQGLAIVDVSDPTMPSLVNNVAMMATNALDVDGNATHAHVAASDGLHVVDVGMAMEVGYLMLDEAKDVQLVGGIAYVADQYTGLNVVDVSTPTMPMSLGAWPSPSTSTPGLQIVGNLAYLAQDDPTGTLSGLRIVDVSNPAMIVELGFFDTPNSCRDPWVVGTTAYIADVDSLQILDVTMPGMITTIGSSAQTPGFNVEVEVDGSYAYLADSGSGLLIMDISDATAPRLMGNYGTDGTVSDLVLAGNFAFTAAEAGGLAVYDKLDVALGWMTEHDMGATGSMLTYTVTWIDRYPGSDEEVACTVSSGTCNVASIDQMANTADIEWTLPTMAGFYELAVAVGNHQQWLVINDRARAQ